MTHPSDPLLSLLIVYIAAQIGAEIAQRLKTPAVVGEILAGCLIGPFALNLVTPNESLEVLSELGAVFLLFSVGLENRLGDLRQVGKMAALVGSLGVVLPFVTGAGWGSLTGHSFAHALFIGAAFVATSAGITARVLHELGALNRLESKVILGAAVIDDILAMLLLVVVTSLQGGGSIDLTGLALVALQGIGFVIALAFLGTKFMQRSSDLLDAPINPLSPLTLSLAGCLALAVGASYVGLAAIIGAFLAGTILAESKQHHVLGKQIQPLLAFFVPFFFVLTGTRVDLTQFSSFSAVGTILVVTILAALSKLIACGLAAWPLGKRGSLLVGVGMIPRGEVGIIVATLGLHSGVLSTELYGTIICMSLLTSIIAPPLLKTLLADMPEERTEDASTGLTA